MISSLSQFDYICVDVSNGYIKPFYDRVKQLRHDYPNSQLIAGNVCTREAVKHLFSLGVDIVKYGIGNGSCCTTSLKTGVGFPRERLISEVYDLLKNPKNQIMYDGGVKTPGEVACLLALGFSHVMLGSIFAGHDNMGVPEYIDEYRQFDINYLMKTDRTRYYKVYGMSSKEAHDKYHSNCSRKQRAYEGKSNIIQSKGHLQDTVNDLLGSLASACSFTSSPNILDLQKAEVIWN
jgi:GMP reductase